MGMRCERSRGAMLLLLAQPQLTSASVSIAPPLCPPPCAFPALPPEGGAAASWESITSSTLLGRARLATGPLDAPTIMVSRRR